MDHFAGLDVSVKETSVCIVDETGKVVREVKVASEPEALLAVLKNPAYHFTRIGLEAGPLSQWLFSALAEAELPVVCVETRHMQAVLKAQINKTDRNDARGIAQMMRVGLYRPVHVKTLRSQKLRMLLTHRKLLQSKAIAIENDLRGTLRNFGLKVGMVGKVKFETRIKELLENLPGKSKKLTLICWMLILNCDSTINASIMISDSAAASAGRRNSASQTPLRKHQVSSASPSANALRSIQPMVTSAAMCGATTAAAFGQLTRGGIVSAAQRCLVSDRRAARMIGARK